MSISQVVLFVFVIQATVARLLEVPSYVCDSITDKPQLNFEIELQDTTVNRGDEVLLKCSAYGAPQAGLTWYHKGRRIGDYPSAGLELALPTKMIGQGLVESTLRICADTKTVGDYVCVATNPCGQSITSEATISLAKGKGKSCNAKKLDLLPYIKMSTVQRMEYTGNPVQLMCRATGSPKPQIKWYRINEEDQLEDVAEKSEYMVLSNGDLLVLNEDPNIVSESFRCVAKNGNGQAEADSTIIFMEQ
jgi:hypothetical protein